MLRRSFFEADDYLGPCRNRSFETYDRQTVNGTVNCAVYLQSGWWLSSSCSNASDMNVPYVPVAKSDLSGVQWSQNGVPMRLNIVEMKIRPLSLSQGITDINMPACH